jgi:hypothetical protein
MAGRNGPGVSRPRASFTSGASLTERQRCHPERSEGSAVAVAEIALLSAALASTRLRSRGGLRHSRSSLLHSHSGLLHSRSGLLHSRSGLLHSRRRVVASLGDLRPSCDACSSRLLARGLRVAGSCFLLLACGSSLPACCFSIPGRCFSAAVCRYRVAPCCLRLTACDFPLPTSASRFRLAASGVPDASSVVQPATFDCRETLIPYLYM